MKDFKYIVFRTFSPDEEEFELGPVYYGWSSSKKIIKGFLAQRTKGRYTCKKMTDEEIMCETFSNDNNMADSMIRLLMLPSVIDHVKYPLFITNNESKEVEKKIHFYFTDLASFEKYPKIRIKLLSLYINLKDECKAVLETIGFIPKELNDMGYMESEDTFTCLENEIDTLIDEAYACIEPTKDNEYDDRTKIFMPKSQLYLNDMHSHFCYSLEGYIKILSSEF